MDHYAGTEGVQAELAKKLKMHANTVQAALDELERAGAIAVQAALISIWNSGEKRRRSLVRRSVLFHPPELTDLTYLSIIFQ